MLLVVVRFVDIESIVARHCLFFPLMMFHV